MSRPSLTQIELEKRSIDLLEFNRLSINNYSSNDLPCEVADDGKEISYELALYRESPYSLRIYNEIEN